MLVTEESAAGCLERVERSDDIVMDTETTGLKTWTGDKVVGVACKAGGTGMYFPFRHGAGTNLAPERLRQLVKALSGKRLRGFHLRFDLEMMHNEGLPAPPQIEDTLIAAVLMNENEPSFALKRSKNGTKGLSLRYLGDGAAWADKELRAKLESAGLSKNEMWKLPGEDVAEYACSDLDLPEELMERIYRPGLKRWGLEGIFREYNAYQQCLIDMEIQGTPVDRATVDRALLDGETSREQLLAEIHQAAGYPLNPNSWKQVSAWLGTPNAQEETVLRSNHPQAHSLIDYKAYGKRDSTYLQKFIDFACSRGLLHCQLNLTRDERDMGGTRSARLSMSLPNLQAMPKPTTNVIYSACRQAIAAPEGYFIGEADYKQIEVRIATHYSQEPALFDVFSAGRDIYAEFAVEVQPLVPGFSRQDAKILHLAIQYGAGVWKVAEMLGCTEDQARTLRNAWHRRFPRISRMMRSLQEMAEKNGVIRLWSGRWGHFDGERKSVHCKSPYYTAWNRLIQGSVAEIVRVAMMRLREVLASYGARMLLQVHDSILFLGPIQHRAAICRAVREHMENFPEWDVPTLVDIKTGPNWLDVKEWKETA